MFTQYLKSKQSTSDSYHMEGLSTESFADTNYDPLNDIQQVESLTDDLLEGVGVSEALENQRRIISNATHYDTLVESLGYIKGLGRTIGVSESDTYALLGSKYAFESSFFNIEYSKEVMMEGLGDFIVSVKDKIVEIVNKIIAWFKDKYRRFKEWLFGKKKDTSKKADEASKKLDKVKGDTVKIKTETKKKVEKALLLQSTKGLDRVIKTADSANKSTTPPPTTPTPPKTQPNEGFESVKKESEKAKKEQQTEVKKRSGKYKWSTTNPNAGTTILSDGSENIVQPLKSLTKDKLEEEIKETVPGKVKKIEGVDEIVKEISKEEGNPESIVTLIPKPDMNSNNIRYDVMVFHKGNDGSVKTLYFKDSATLEYYIDEDGDNTKRIDVEDELGNYIKDNSLDMTSMDIDEDTKQIKMFLEDLNVIAEPNGSDKVIEPPIETTPKTKSDLEKNPEQLKTEADIKQAAKTLIESEKSKQEVVGAAIESISQDIDRTLEEEKKNTTTNNGSVLDSLQTLLKAHTGETLSSNLLNQQAAEVLSKLTKDEMISIIDGMHRDKVHLSSEFLTDKAYDSDEHYIKVMNNYKDNKELLYILSIFHFLGRSNHPLKKAYDPKKSKTNIDYDKFKNDIITLNLINFFYNLFRDSYQSFELTKLNNGVFATRAYFEKRFNLLKSGIAMTRNIEGENLLIPPGIIYLLPGFNKEEEIIKFRDYLDKKGSYESRVETFNQFVDLSIGEDSDYLGKRRKRYFKWFVDDTRVLDIINAYCNIFAFNADNSYSLTLRKNEIIDKLPLPFADFEKEMMNVFDYKKDFFCVFSKNNACFLLNNMFVRGRLTYKTHSFTVVDILNPIDYSSSGGGKKSNMSFLSVPVIKLNGDK